MTSYKLKTLNSERHQIKVKFLNINQPESNIEVSLQVFYLPYITLNATKLCKCKTWTEYKQLSNTFPSIHTHITIFMSMLPTPTTGIGLVPIKIIQ